jgi:solute:Na+ symporter, SSS family
VALAAGREDFVPEVGGEEKDELSKSGHDIEVRAVHPGFTIRINPQFASVVGGPVGIEVDDGRDETGFALAVAVEVGFVMGPGGEAGEVCLEVKEAEKKFAIENEAEILHRGPVTLLRGGEGIRLEPADVVTADLGADLLFPASTDSGGAVGSVVPEGRDLGDESLAGGAGEEVGDDDVAGRGEFAGDGGEVATGGRLGDTWCGHWDGKRKMRWGNSPQDHCQCDRLWRQRKCALDSLLCDRQSHSVMLLPFSPTGSVLAAVPAPHAAGLMAVDWFIIVIYAVSTIVLGWWFGRSQTTAKEYFVGSGSMDPTLIGVSLFASLLSTITYLSIPGETLGKGPVFLTNYLAYPLIYLIVAYALLPVYMKQRVTSAYELLEARLGLSVRLLAAGMFLLLRLVWMALLIYLMSTAIATMIGIEVKWVPLIALVTGAVSVTYATLGGLRAVVITDLIQTILLYGGALLVIGIITVRMGGFSWFPGEWKANWDHQPLFSLDPAVRVTMVGTFFSVLIWYVCTAGGDQVSVQRFMATKDLRSARVAIGIQLTIGTVVGLTLGIAGFALLGYFTANPDLLPPELRAADQADKIFPHFIAAHLPPIVSGLVVSGLFAAAMSSVDSGVNSITAVVTSDFVDRLRRKPVSEARRVWLARVIAFSVGAIVVGFSSFIGKVPGNITAVTNKTVNLLTVPIFCFFFFALFVKFARPAGVWAGAIAGTLAGGLIAFSGPIFGNNPVTGSDPISFQWIAPVTLVVNLVVGLAVSFLVSRIDKRADIAI